jgi:transposase-like protein
MDIFSAARFTDDTAAREYLETVLWPVGPVCPHCGVFNRAYKVTRKGRFQGVYRCAEKECRKDFTVTMKTVMERSHIPLHKWMQGFHLMTASKKGVSAHQLHRMLDMTYEAAWFMAHRIREAMRDGGLKPPTPMGGEGKIVEADKTYFGNVQDRRPSPQRRGQPYTKSGKSGPGGKRAILALVERGGSVRTFHVPVADKDTVERITRENIARESRLHTDESRLYFGASGHFASHETVVHSHKEYVRDDVHTNSAEGVLFDLQARHARHLSAL